MLTGIQPVRRGVLMAVLLSCPVAFQASTPDDRAASVGVWLVESVEVNGRQVDPRTTELLQVTYREDGSWTVLFKGLPVGEGTSHNNPETRPKTFDMHTLGGTKTPSRAYTGIYSVDDNTRRLCFVSADKPRPDSFAAPRGSGRILVTLKRAGEPVGR